MLPNRTQKRWIVLLALASLASITPSQPAQAGPISEMLARHRQAKSLRLPPVDKPHTIKKIKDPYTQTASLSQRFKQRFNLRRNASGLAPTDQGLIKTSR